MDTKGAGDGLKISFSPTRDQLHEVLRWLKTEQEESGEGFYCNRGVITSSFDAREFAVATRSGHAIAFCVWQARRAHGEVNIVSVLPQLRRHGIGRRLVNDVLLHLAKEGGEVVAGECTPSSSEPFWRSMGFEDHPFEPRSDSGAVRLFRRLVPYREPVSEPASTSALHFWACGPWDIEGVSPTCSWDLGPPGPDGWVLDPPILHPCTDPDWWIEVHHEGRKVHEDKAKRTGEPWHDCSGYLRVKRFALSRGT